MGKENDMICSYLDNRERFADLFNGSFFEGRQVVKPDELMEGSEVYTGRNQAGGSTYHRIRDLKKWLRSGLMLQVLAVEAQGYVDYSMPLRCMGYDYYEYEKQLKAVKQKNREEVSADRNERLSMVKKTDLLVPAYTLCLYHGTEDWNGPRSLKDMMAFGEDREKWEEWFADYPSHLVCVNEWKDFNLFRTPLRELFRILPYRKDKSGLTRLLEEDPAYEKLDGETAVVLGELMGVNHFMEKKEKYRKEDKYNMCQALREMMEDSRQEGIRLGKTEGENLLAALIQKLLSDGRLDDVRLAADNDKMRNKFYQEYGIDNHEYH